MQRPTNNEWHDAKTFFHHHASRWKRCDGRNFGGLTLNYEKQALFLNFPVELFTSFSCCGGECWVVAQVGMKKHHSFFITHIQSIAFEPSYKHYSALQWLLWGDCELLSHWIASSLASHLSHSVFYVQQTKNIWRLVRREENCVACILNLYERRWNNKRNWSLLSCLPNQCCERRYDWDISLRLTKLLVGSRCKIAPFLCAKMLVESMV